MEFAYAVLGVVAWQIMKMVYQIARRGYLRRQEKRFIREVRISFPDAQDIRVITVTTSDRDTFELLRNQLNEQYKHNMVVELDEKDR